MPPPLRACFAPLHIQAPAGRGDFVATFSLFFTCIYCCCSAVPRHQVCMDNKERGCFPKHRCCHVITETESKMPVHPGLSTPFRRATARGNCTGNLHLFAYDTDRFRQKHEQCQPFASHLTGQKSLNIPGTQAAVCHLNPRHQSAWQLRGRSQQ